MRASTRIFGIGKTGVVDLLDGVILHLSCLFSSAGKAACFSSLGGFENEVVADGFIEKSTVVLFASGDFWPDPEVGGASSVEVQGGMDWEIGG